MRIAAVNGDSIRYAAQLYDANWPSVPTRNCDSADIARVLGELADADARSLQMFSSAPSPSPSGGVEFRFTVIIDLATRAYGEGAEDISSKYYTTRFLLQQSIANALDVLDVRNSVQDVRGMASLLADYLTIANNRRPVTAAQLAGVLRGMELSELHVISQTPSPSQQPIGLTSAPAGSSLSRTDAIIIGVSIGGSALLLLILFAVISSFYRRPVNQGDKELAMDSAVPVPIAYDGQEGFGSPSSMSTESKAHPADGSEQQMVYSPATAMAVASMNGPPSPLPPPSMMSPLVGYDNPLYVNPNFANIIANATPMRPFAAPVQVRNRAMVSNQQPAQPMFGGQPAVGLPYAASRMSSAPSASVAASSYRPMNLMGAVASARKASGTRRQSRYTANSEGSVRTAGQDTMRRQNRRSSVQSYAESTSLRSQGDGGAGAFSPAPLHRGGDDMYAENATPAYQMPGSPRQRDAVHDANDGFSPRRLR